MQYASSAMATCCSTRSVAISSQENEQRQEHKQSSAQAQQRVDSKGGALEATEQPRQAYPRVTICFTIHCHGGDAQPLGCTYQAPHGRTPTVHEERSLLTKRPCTKDTPPALLACGEHATCNLATVGNQQLVYCRPGRSRRRLATAEPRTAGDWRFSSRTSPEKAQAQHRHTAPPGAPERVCQGHGSRLAVSGSTWCREAGGRAGESAGKGGGVDLVVTSRERLLPTHKCLQSAQRDQQERKGEKPLHLLQRVRMAR
jgi:hypothetical protein